jgi:hypothetical protein
MLPTKFHFGQAVSQEKIQMWADDGRQVMAKADMAFCQVS